MIAKISLRAPKYSNGREIQKQVLTREVEIRVLTYYVIDHTLSIYVLKIGRKHLRVLRRSDVMVHKLAQHGCAQWISSFSTNCIMLPNSLMNRQTDVSLTQLGSIFGGCPLPL